MRSIEKGKGVGNLHIPYGIATSLCPRENKGIAVTEVCSDSHLETDYFMRISDLN